MIVMDTDVCIELLRGNRRVIAHRQKTAGDVAISFMTVGELFYGVARSSQPGHNRELVELLLLSVACLQSDRAVMERFGTLKADLAERGESLADADLLIAATALTHGGTLISGNRSHFARIPGLTVLDWTK
jgi:tRNA(fMet)-specific endonuclease VapC